MPDVVLVGGGGHARVLLRALRDTGRPVRGYVAPCASRDDLALDWLGDDEALLAATDRVAGGVLAAVLALGKHDGGAFRLALQQRYEAFGYAFAPLVAPGAVVHADVTLGDGSVVLAGAAVITGSRVGRACIVNTHASVDHDCALGDDVHVGPGAILCGGVRVGAHTFVGAGATVVPGIRIAPGVVIGAGATVVRDVEAAGVYVGSPARRLR